MATYDGDNNRTGVSSAADYSGARSGRGISGKWLVIGVVGVLVASGIFIWVQMGRESAPSASMTSAGWDIVDDQTVTATVDVTRDDPTRDAYCIVYAMDYSRAEVGRREFVVEPSDSASVRMQVDVPTRARAVATAEYGCSTELPAYLHR